MRSTLLLSVLVALATACAPAKQQPKVVYAGFDPNRSIAEQMAENVKPLTTSLLIEVVRYGNMSLLHDWTGPAFKNGSVSEWEDVLASASLDYAIVTASIKLSDTAKVGGAAGLCKKEVEHQQEVARIRARPENAPPPKDVNEALEMEMEDLMASVSFQALKNYDVLPDGGCRIEEVTLETAVPRYIYIQPLPGNPAVTVTLTYDVPPKEGKNRTDADENARRFLKRITVTE